MSNASRLAGRKEKKVRQPRTKKVKVDMSKLPDAIVDGKFVVKEKGRVYFERHANKRVEIHIGEAWKVEGDLVTIWDETRGQFYAFSLKQELPLIKAASLEDVVLVKEAPASVSVDGEADQGTLGGDPGGDPEELSVVVPDAAT